MKRRPVGRKASLTIRMAIALLLLLALYAGIVALAVAIASAGVGWAIGVIGICVALGSALVSQLGGSGGFYLRSASLDTYEPAAEVSESLVRLAALADIPAPKLLVTRSDDANAFTVGLTHGSAVVVITTELWRRLEPDELDAVFAHELTHVINRDAAVMSVANVPRTLGLLLAVGRSEGDDLTYYLWFFVWPLGLPIFVLGTLVTLALSRVREYAADRGAAVLTGAPESLMSALQKISDAESASGDLRAVEALCIAPSSIRPMTLLMDHPPLEKRLAALAALARELGRPAHVTSPS